MRRQIGATTAMPVPAGPRIRGHLVLMIALLLPLLLGYGGSLLVPNSVLGVILLVAGCLVTLAFVAWFVFVALRESTSLGGKWFGYRLVDSRTGQPNGGQVLTKYLVQFGFELVTLGFGAISYYFTYQDGSHWIDRSFNILALPAEEEEADVQVGDAAATPVPRPAASTPFSSPQGQAFNPLPQRGLPPSADSPQRQTPSPGFSAPQPSGFATVSPAVPSPVQSPPQPRFGRPATPSPPQSAPEIPSPDSASAMNIFQPSPSGSVPEPPERPQSPIERSAPQPSPFSPPSAIPRPTVFPAPVSPVPEGSQPSHAWATSPNAPVFPPVAHIPARATDYGSADDISVKPAHAARALKEDSSQLEDATVAEITGASSLTAVPAVVLDDGQRITVDGPLVLGRNPLVPDAYPNARSVQVMDETMRLSKTHLVLYREERRVYVVDIGATNGVYAEVNGERARLLARDPRELRQDDLIHFGGRTLRLAP